MTRLDIPVAHLAAAKGLITRSTPDLSDWTIQILQVSIESPTQIIHPAGIQLKPLPVEPGLSKDGMKPLFHAALGAGSKHLDAQRDRGCSLEGGQSLSDVSRDSDLDAPLGPLGSNDVDACALWLEFHSDFLSSSPSATMCSDLSTRDRSPSLVPTQEEGYVRVEGQARSTSISAASARRTMSAVPLPPANAIT